MVSNEAKWILRNIHIDPKMVADVWGIDETECWQYLDDLNRVLREAHETRDPLAVQKEMREWVATIPNRNNIRIEAIRDQLIDAKTNPEKHDVEKLLFEVAILKGDVKQITPQDVERAKAHPIENLLAEPPKRGVALCPLHNEKTPSFNIKNNKYKCFGCGAHGDVIDLYKAIHNTDFITAVKALQ